MLFYVNEYTNNGKYRTIVLNSRHIVKIRESSDSNNDYNAAIVYLDGKDSELILVKESVKTLFALAQ